MLFLVTVKDEILSLFSMPEIRKIRQNLIGQVYKLLEKFREKAKNWTKFEVTMVFNTNGFPEK